MVGFMAVLAIPAAAEITSTNYSIITTVMYAGVGLMSSANFQMNSTLVQSSPLIDPAYTPQSASYKLSTVFWHTVGVGFRCYYDYTGDVDVDGAELAELINGFSLTELETFALAFG